jgi:hypothetical protein
MSYLTKQELVNKINTNFASAKPEKITATDLREVMLDCSDSLANIEDTNSYSVTSKVGESLVNSLKEVWPSNAGTFHFATTSIVSQTIVVKTSTGYARLIDGKGTLNSVVGSGNPSAEINVVVPEGGGTRCFGVVSTTSNGSVRNGNILYIYAYAKRIITFDASSLTSLTYLNLGNNQLSSLNVSSLTSLTSLYLVNNKLKSFDGSNLSSLVHLYLNGNQIKNFSSTGLNSLTQLSLVANGLSSFSAPNLTNLLSLFLASNNITQFDKTGLTNLIELDLNSNPIQQFNGNGLTNLNTIDLSNCQLNAFSNLQSSQLTIISIYNNLLSSQVLDTLFNDIAYMIYNNAGTINCSTNSGQPTNASFDARDLLIGGGWTIIT